LFFPCDVSFRIEHRRSITIAVRLQPLIRSPARPLIGTPWERGKAAPPGVMRGLGKLL
jgi:hypothetical protein